MQGLSTPAETGLPTRHFHQHANRNGKQWEFLPDTERVSVSPGATTPPSLGWLCAGLLCCRGDQRKLDGPLWLLGYFTVGTTFSRLEFTPLQGERGKECLLQKDLGWGSRRLLGRAVTPGATATLTMRKGGGIGVLLPTSLPWQPQVQPSAQEVWGRRGLDSRVHGHQLSSRRGGRRKVCPACSPLPQVC